MKNIFLALTLVPIFAFAATDKEIMEGKDTTPLKLLCKIVGGSSNSRLLVQFVKDKQAVPGVYSAVNGMFYPGNKIVKITYGLYGESYAKIGHLDNGGKVRIHLPVEGVDFVGTIDKTNALFGDGANLSDCIELKLK